MVAVIVGSDWIPNSRMRTIEALGIRVQSNSTQLQTGLGSEKLPIKIDRTLVNVKFILAGRGKDTHSAIDEVFTFSRIIVSQRYNDA